MKVGAILIVPGPLLDFVRTDELYFDAVFWKPINRNVVCLFEAGDTAIETVKLSDEEIKTKVLRESDDIFDGKASKHFVQYYVQNWSQKPYIQAAYSYNYDDFWDDMEVLQRSVDSRIYFAGEQLIKSGFDFSSVHGAALSRRKVAQQMIGASRNR